MLCLRHMMQTFYLSIGFCLGDPRLAFELGRVVLRTFPFSLCILAAACGAVQFWLLPCYFHLTTLTLRPLKTSQSFIAQPLPTLFTLLPTRQIVSEHFKGEIFSFPSFSSTAFEGQHRKYFRGDSVYSRKALDYLLFELADYEPFGAWGRNNFPPQP